MSECMNEWMYVWSSGCMNEWMNETKQTERNEMHGHEKKGNNMQWDEINGWMTYCMNAWIYETKRSEIKSNARKVN